MADSDFKIPKSLRIALKEKRVVPFVGAGASIPVKKKNADGTKSDESLFLSWKDFIEFLIQGLRDENKNGEAEFIRLGLETKRMTYLDALEQIQQILGKGLWYDLFEKSFGFLESEAHPDSFRLNRLIWELSNNLIITTNIDRVLYWACPKPLDFNLLNVQKVKHAQLQNEKTIKRPTVWHLHGHIDHVEEIIFTRDQFESFYKRKDNEAKFQTLISFLTQRTFVFIGFSLDDDYLRELLQYIHDIYKGGADSYYILFRERNIANANFPDYVTPVPFSDFGKPLEDLVEELARIAKDNDDDGGDKSVDGKAQSPVKIKKDAEKPFFGVPYRSKGDEFVGREGKKEEIWNALNKGGCASIGQAVSVKGFGGLGKTQLAVEFADAYKGRYKNGVYWLVADSNIENQIVQIAEERKWINKDDKSINQIEVAKEIFKQLSECLILVDNVEAFDDVKDYLPKTDSNTHLLITSREKDGRFHEIDIDLLNREESRKLLQKVSKRNPTDDREKSELEKILEILGGIPLAVELVGGFLKEHKDISFGEYLEYLENVPLSELEEEFPKSSFTSHDHSIIRTLRISEKTIEEKPLLTEILKVLAWSGSSSMGVSLLKDTIAPDNDFKFRIALSDAVNLRLINKDQESERYTIHRLLAKVIRFEESLETQKDWLKKKAENLEKWFDDRKEEFNYLADFEAETEHLVEWQKNTIEYLSEKTIWFIALESYPLWQRGNYKISLQFLEKAFGLYDSKKINNPELLANLNNDLGIIYGALGEHQIALEYQEKALELRKNFLGENHSDTATSYNNVGLTYGALGDHRKALEYQEKALDLQKELFDEKLPLTAKFYNNVGGTYGALGEHRKALEYKEKALYLQKKLFGNHHPLTAKFYNNVGLTYKALGEHRKALEYQEKAFQTQQELMGNLHPDTILYCINLIITYFELGNKFKAREKLLEYFYIVPQNNPHWKWFEENSRPYRPNKNRQKKKNRR